MTTSSVAYVTQTSTQMPIIFAQTAFYQIASLVPQLPYVPAVSLLLSYAATLLADHVTLINIRTLVIGNVKIAQTIAQRALLEWLFAILALVN